MVRVSDLWSTDCDDRLYAGKPSLTGHLGQLGLLSLRRRYIEYRSLAEVKAGSVHLCRVTGNTV